MLSILSQLPILWPVRRYAPFVPSESSVKCLRLAVSYRALGIGNAKPVADSGSGALGHSKDAAAGSLRNENGPLRNCAMRNAELVSSQFAGQARSVCIAVDLFLTAGHDATTLKGLSRCHFGLCDRL
jgi:hypothetical protein